MTPVLVCTQIYLSLLDTEANSPHASQLAAAMEKEMKRTLIVWWPIIFLVGLAIFLLVILQLVGRT